MKNLGIINTDFPQVKVTDLNAAVAGIVMEQDTCDCPPRQQPPKRPDQLPFEPCEGNINSMKQWLLERFARSTFNKCTHQRLPMMDCQPVKIHVKRDAEPITAKKGPAVPLHWRDKVKEQLDQDVRLGILEKVPVGTPVKWLHRMHVVAKENGRPRRTVDLRTLNDHCLRETQHVSSPYKQARLIPSHTWKTKTDCWNGYHSCPLEEADKDLTTFTTEWGRYRYRAVP